MTRYYIGLKVGFFWLVVGLVTGISPVMGQTIPKKVLKESDYHLWGRLSIGKMNENGNWMSWKMSYENGKDTLYIGKTSGKSKAIFLVESRDEDFLGKDLIACIEKNNILSVFELEKKSSWKKAGVNHFENLKEKRVLLVESVGQNGLSDLSIIDYRGKELVSIGCVKFWKYNPQKTIIAITIQDAYSSQCVFFRLSDMNLKTIIKSAGVEMEIPVWDSTGQFMAVASIGKVNEAGKLFLYDAHLDRLAMYDADLDPLFPVERNIVSSGIIDLTVGPQGKGVFFGTALRLKPKNNVDNEIVQVWNTSDKLLYPWQKKVEASQKPLLTFWDAEKNKIIQIADNNTPSVGLTGLMDFGISWNNFAYEPQLERDSPVDYYIIDYRKDSKKIWLKHQPQNSVYPIKSSSKILFKTEGWKLYDTKTEMVQEIDIVIDKVPPERALEKTAFDPTPASDISGNWLIVHDGYDLWKYNMLNNAKIRLTRGREKGIIYTLPEEDLHVWKNYNFNFIRSFDLSKPLVLKAKRKDESATGYYSLSKGGEIKEIIFGEMGYNDITISPHGNCIAFTSESFEYPRSVNTACKGKINTIFQSNLHQKYYYWGKSNLVTYKVGDKDLRGILYSPEQIDPKLKYPLIAEVYEKQSDCFFFNRIPSMINGNGFNIANLVAKGYFVLLPDIDYELGNPGRNALNCLDSALNAVVSNYPIDATKLGLVGHSFGGYEVSSIICNSDRFAAAVVGAGITNAISYYLSPNINNMRANYWRYEYAQMRIGKSLFDDKDLYFANSAVLNAEKIETPVMIWIGKKDTQVNPEQGFDLYMALRRLNKPSALLVYPNEAHNLSDLKTNEDLTLRIEQWFDHFLLDKLSSWIK